MSNYVKSTNFATKDTLPAGDTNKIVKGTEIDTEFNNIATAVSTKADTASPTFTGTTTLATATITTANITTANITNALAVASGGTGVTTSTGSGAVVLGTSPTLAAPRVAGSSTGYTTVASANTGATNFTATLPAENFTVGFRNLPAVGTKTGSYTLAVGDVGKYVQVGSGGSITIPDATFTEGDAVSIFNNTSGNITITCSITTAYIAGTDADKATITLATRGVATILFISGTVCVVSGTVT